MIVVPGRCLGLELLYLLGRCARFSKGLGDPTKNAESIAVESGELNGNLWMSWGHTSLHTMITVTAMAIASSPTRPTRNRTRSSF